MFFKERDIAKPYRFIYNCILIKPRTVQITHQTCIGNEFHVYLYFSAGYCGVW